MSPLLAVLTALAYVCVGLAFAVVCVILIPLAIVHIVYTNWKEHTL